MEHQNSIKFAEKNVREIKRQIEELCKEKPYLVSMEFNFLKEVAYLVLAARRTLSYAYVVRFDLRGKEK